MDRHYFGPLRLGMTVKIRWHDGETDLRGKTGKVVSLPNGISPNWCDVEIDGTIYALRGDELNIVAE